ncbi:MAG TPA: hypothetical protein VIX63_06750 [Vicinamibacterales bacterium]
MAPEVWLYTNDGATFRTVQRRTEAGTEVLVFGSAGERAHETFVTTADAAAFRLAVEARILRNGFALARGPAGAP